MGKTNAVDLLELLPTSLLDSLSAETGVDYKVHKLRGRLMFNLLLYGMLEEDRLSLRTLEDCFQSSKFKFFFHLPLDQTTSYTSLSDRLSNMKVSYFAQLYAASYEIFRKHFDEPTILKYHLRRVDSTMVCEQARKLAEGMSVGCKKDGKKQIKISLSLTNLFPSSFEFFTSQSALSEEVALPIELFKSNLAKESNNVIAVFDRGIAQQKVYTELTNEDVFFVTRIKQNTNYDTLKEIPDNIGRNYHNLTLVAEREIRLKKSRQHTFRLIEAINEDGKTLLFLTNCWELPIHWILLSYRRRWDIEVFFRFLKQELNLSHLMSMNENGIQIILYMTMILAMLILIYKKRNQIGYKTAKRRFKMELDNYITALIIEACGGDSSKWMNLPNDGFG